MEWLLLLMFRPDLFEAIYYPIKGDAKLVLQLATDLDCTEAAIVEYAAKHAGVEYTMDEFYANPVLPWRVRHWIRENSPTLNS